MTTIGALIDEVAHQHADRPALISAERCVSFSELGREAKRTAKGLARIGVSKGTRVGILLPNRPEWLACAFGALKLGAIVVPLNTLHRRAELEYTLRHADVTVLVTVSRFLNHAYVDLLREICPALDRAQRPLALPQLPALREVVVAGEPQPTAAVHAHAVAWRGAATAVGGGAFTSGVLAIASRHGVRSRARTVRKEQQCRDDLQRGQPKARRRRDHGRLPNVGESQGLQQRRQRHLARANPPRKGECKITEDIRRRVHGDVVQR